MHMHRSTLVAMLFIAAGLLAAVVLAAAWPARRPDAAAPPAPPVPAGRYVWPACPSPTPGAPPGTRQGGTP